jgi:hypothetical protein
MRSEHQVMIPGTLADVLAVAASVERWSLLMPHYRWVRFIGRQGQGTVVEIGARRGPLWVRWTTEQLVFADEGRIVFRHLKGITTGLWTEWRLAQAGPRVAMVVSHDWQPGWPLIGPVAAAVFFRLLVEPLTQRTMDEVGRLVATGQAAALRRLRESGVW